MSNETPMLLGRRIVVWGVTGSGKTTFALALGQVLGVPAIQLDALFWKPDWVETPDDQFRAKIERAVSEAGDGWVIDGSYSRINSAYLPLTDTVIWLHLPWRVCFWRLFRRTVSRAWTREPLYYDGGPQESWRLSFFDRKSILWWSISRHRYGVKRRRELINTLPSGVRVYELRSPKEVEQFISGVKRPREAPSIPSA
jgi:adenylate kinase family enzyme